MRQICWLQRLNKLVMVPDNYLNPKYISVISFSNFFKYIYIAKCIFSKSTFAQKIQIVLIFISRSWLLVHRIKILFYIKWYKAHRYKIETLDFKSLLIEAGKQFILVFAKIYAWSFFRVMKDIFRKKFKFC